MNIEEAELHGAVELLKFAGVVFLPLVLAAVAEISIDLVKERLAKKNKKEKEEEHD